MDFYPPKTSIPEERKYRIRVEGVNGDNPTKELGAGVTVTRTGEGAYRITWASNPGTFIGWSKGFGAATPADLAGYTAVRDEYDSTNKRLDFVVYSDTPAAADLIADQWIDVVVEFAETSEVA